MARASGLSSHCWLVVLMDKSIFKSIIMGIIRSSIRNFRTSYSELSGVLVKVTAMVNIHADIT